MYHPLWSDLDVFIDPLTQLIMSFSTHFKIDLLPTPQFNINLLSCNYSRTRKITQFLYYTNLINFVTQPTYCTDYSETLINLICTDTLVLKVNVDCKT